MEYKQFQANYRGEPSQPFPQEAQLNWMRPDLVFLDQHVEYQFQLLGIDNVEKACYTSLPSGATRDLWLSPICNVVHQSLCTHGRNDDTLAWAVLGCYQPCPLYFHTVGMDLVKKQKGPSSYAPSVWAEFGKQSWKSGGGLMRWRVPSLDYHERLFGDEGEATRNELLETIRGLCDWVEKNGDTADPASLRLQLEETHVELQNGKHTKRLEIAEFRLTVLLQILALAGWFNEKGGCGFVEAFYPVEGSGGYKHLQGDDTTKKLDESAVALAMRLISDHVGLPEYRAYQPESLLCEGSPARQNIFDYLVEGMDLFLLDKWPGGNGLYKSRRKPYGEYTWQTI